MSAARPALPYFFTKSSTVMGRSMRPSVRNCKGLYRLYVCTPRTYNGGPMRRRRTFAYEKHVSELSGDSTFDARLKMAMMLRGIKTPSELGEIVGVSRVTAQSWMMGRRVKLTPILAYKLADALGANARWLILGPPNTPERPIYLTPEQVSLLNLYDALGADQAEDWVAMGRKLAVLAGKALKAAPRDITPAATLKPMANSQNRK